MAEQEKEENKKPISFLQTFFEDRNTPLVYNKVQETVTGNVLFERADSEVPNELKKVYSITDIPGFLELKVNHNMEVYKSKSCDLFDGFLVNLKKYNGVEDYLKDNFGKNGRSKIRRYIKRLELCIEPTYKMYYGEIEEAEYNKLFDRLRELMMRRFSQKQEENIELPVLEEYRGLMRKMIINKQASLFVIYHGEKPIDICMNIIYDNIVTSYNSSYDIDYEAFSLGTIDVMKHVEWCFDQGFDIFDMGRGDYLYKRRWTNHKYQYRRELVYDTSSVYHSTLSNLKMSYNQYKYDFIQFLKKFGVQHLYGKYYQLHYLIFKKNLHVELHEKYDVTMEFDMPEAQSLLSVDITQEQNTWLIKPINDFIYRAHEKYHQVKVVQDRKNKQLYYLLGEKKNLLVKVKNQ